MSEPYRVLNQDGARGQEAAHESPTPNHRLLFADEDDVPFDFLFCDDSKFVIVP
jgi:hypothetical protein